MTESRQIKTIRTTFLERLAYAPIPLLSDGAMGTLLNTRGVSADKNHPFDQCFDALNLTQPALVGEVHRDYIEAGSDIIQTNTFGANRYKLAAHGLQARVAEINQAGVTLAQRAAQGAPAVLIAGDVGPLGVRLAPFGRVQPQEARQAFKEQISALVEAGIDVIIIETFSDLYEIREAVAAAREVSAFQISQGLAPVPVVASMTFTRDDRTLLGDSPDKVARFLADTGADVIGINCSSGPAQLWRILKQMQHALSATQPSDAPAAGSTASRPYFSVMPNAGWPEQVGGRIMYPANPDYFGDYARAFCEAGASLIGGCCGTTPAHIAAMRAALSKQPEGCGYEPAEMASLEVDDRSASPDGASRLAQKFAGGKFVVAVETSPPRGLATHKLLAGASLLAEVGADVIDVTDSPMARMRMSPWAVCDLIQRTVGVETTLHFPTRGRNLLRVQGDLLAAHALGIRNVFVVMGDPTAIGDYPEAMDNYDLVPSGLIKLIKQNFNTGLDHAGGEIGQPTSFYVGCALNLAPQDPEGELKNFRRKIQAGADFALTQPVYDADAAVAFLKRCAEVGANKPVPSDLTHGPLPIPILIGILPLYSVRHANFLHNEVPGITISESMRQRLSAAGDAAPMEGVRIALELIEQMRPWVQGIYLMPQFGRYDLAAEIVEAVVKG